MSKLRQIEKLEKLFLLATYDTNFKCEECRGENLLFPSWIDQNGMQDFPDAFELEGAAWWNDCSKIIFVDTK